MAERIDSLNASVLRRTAALGVISATIALLLAASALSAPMIVACRSEKNRLGFCTEWFSDAG